MCNEFLQCGAGQSSLIFSIGLFVGGVFALRYLAPMIYRPMIELEARRAAALQSKLETAAERKPHEDSDSSA